MGFHVYVNGGVKAGETIMNQRFRFDGRRFHRRPAYLPGNNVQMREDNYLLTSKVNGIVKVRYSKVCPTQLKWIDVEPDVQKEKRSNDLRAEFARRGEAFELHPRNVKARLQALPSLTEPDWRQRVLAVKPLRERFPDPNLMCRGLIATAAPESRFKFE